MREEILWGSIRALGEKRAQDRHYARFYEQMTENKDRLRKPAVAAPDKWKECYKPDPWIDRILLRHTVLSFKVPLSAELQEALQLVRA
jgi:hypothetical protein